MRALPNSRTVYVNVKTSEGVETVDEYLKGTSTYKEIREDVRNWNISDPVHNYYQSTRPTSDWKKK